MIQNYLPLHFNNGIYIEAGANDGVTQSNTHFLEKNFGWTGILVEPSPLKFQECNKNRSGKNKFFECALVGKEEVKSVSGNFVETWWGDSMSSAISEIMPYFTENQKKDVLEKQKRNQITVLAKPLKKIISESGYTKIDFMSLDLEGYELEVLSGYDFSIRPKYILIETTTDLEIKKQMDRFLNGKSYKFVEQITDNDRMYVDSLS